MNAHRTYSGLIAVVLLAAACGSSPSGAGSAHHRRVESITLHPGTYRFAVGNRVHVGERIGCVTRSGAPAGGGSVPAAGHGVGSSTGFEAETAHGVVRITCPADPETPERGPACKTPASNGSLQLSVIDAADTRGRLMTNTPATGVTGAATATTTTTA